MRIEIPAEAIKATTAGRREFKIPCKSARFLYFKYSLAIQVTMMQDGRMHPKVAERAPPGSRNLCSDKGCGIDGDGARCHLGDRDQIREFLHRKPVMGSHDLSLDQRHCRISAAEAEHADLQKTQEKL